MAIPAKFYHYANCSTCKNALKWLKALHIDVELIPIVENPPTAVELARIAKLSDLDFRKLFNTSGVLYRELKLADRITSLDSAQAFALLATHGKLIKRPLLVGSQSAVVGFRPEAYAEWARLHHQV